MKLLLHGHFADGSHTLQRAEALDRRAEIALLRHEALRCARQPYRPGITSRLRWKLGLADDFARENDRLLQAAEATRPDAVLVDNRRVITCETLRNLRQISDPVLAYFSPDDIMAGHNLTGQLRHSLPEWDCVFTTKTFNLAELRAVGVRRPVLVANIFDPGVHRPMSRQEVGADYEAFDAVFIGTFEADRARRINALARAGLRVVVYGPAAGRWAGDWSTLEAGITRRPPAWGPDYTQALHHGKIALCFLRKLNRDRITERSIEIPACARPMLAEKTDEHDEQFVDGEEYVGFTSDDEMIARAHALLADDDRRLAIAGNGYQRCLASGCDVDAVMRELVDKLRAARGVKRLETAVTSH